MTIKFRCLNQEDVIMEGDEYYNARTDEWVPVEHSIGVSYVYGMNPTRRTVSKMWTVIMRPKSEHEWTVEGETKKHAIENAKKLMRDYLEFEVIACDSEGEEE